MLKEAISLPGLAFKFEMGFLKQQGLHLSSFNTDDLYQLFKDNMVGGLAIIFHRYAENEKDQTRANTARPPYPCKKSWSTTQRLVLVGLESIHARGTVHHLDALWRGHGTTQVLVGGGRVAGLGKSRPHPLSQAAHQTQAIARGWLPRRHPDRLRVSRLLLARPSMLVDRSKVHQRRSGSQLAPVRGVLRAHATET